MRQISFIPFLILLFCFCFHASAGNLLPADTVYQSIPKTDWEILLPTTLLKPNESMPGFKAEKEKIVLQVYQMKQAWDVFTEIFGDALVKAQNMKQEPVKIDSWSGWYEVCRVETEFQLQNFIAPWLTTTPAIVHFFVIGKDDFSVLLIGAYPADLNPDLQMAFEQSLKSIRLQQPDPTD